MASDYDATEFVDTDFQAQKSPYGAPAPNDPLRAPTRDEVDRKVVEAQQKLAELKRAQEDLERERATLEELRRRQTEFSTGRDEMTRQLTRGIGLLEEAEFSVMRFKLSASDRLVLLSDGIVEATDLEGKLFGFERVLELMRTSISAAEVADAAQKFGQEDDITVVTIERLAAVERSTAFAAGSLRVPA